MFSFMFYVSNEIYEMHSMKKVSPLVGLHVVVNLLLVFCFLPRFPSRIRRHQRQRHCDSVRRKMK